MSKAVLSLEVINNELSKKNPKQALAHLISKRVEIQKYHNAEDFAVSTMDVLPKELQGFEQNFIAVRAVLANYFWKNNYLIGISVIDDLLFSILQDTSKSKPIEELVNFIASSVEEGFIVYPVHSMGITGAGWANFFGDIKTRIIMKKFGLILTAQLNRKEDFSSFLKQVSMAFKTPKPKKSDIEHYLVSRPIKWATQNPLLVLKINALSGDYYENQFLFTIKLRLATSAIFMISAISGKNDKNSASSTSQVNNFQTLDIKHYLLCESIKSNLSIKCIPMHSNRTDLVELSDLNVEIDPSVWSKKKNVTNKITDSLKFVEQEFFLYCVGLKNKKEKSVRFRVFNKIFQSIIYFNKSSRKHSTLSEQVLMLAIAFETLLTDHYSSGVEKRLKRRMGILLKGNKDKEKLLKNIKLLYSARSEVAHSGEIEQKDIDIDAVRETFVYVFLSLVAQTKKFTFPKKSSSPIADIIGDKITVEEN